MNPHHYSTEGIEIDEDHLYPPLNLNAWSYFLVMMTLQVKVFQYGEERLLAQRLATATNHGEPEHEEGATQPPHISDRLNKQVTHLEGVLSLWTQAYASHLPSPQNSDPTSLYHHHAAAVLGKLSRVYLSVPITDLQEAIGKGGNAMIAPAMLRLSAWMNADPRKAEAAAIEAVNTIERILWFQKRQQPGLKGAERTVDASPYNIITLFLCYVLLWAVTTVARQEQTHELRQALRDALLNREGAFRSRSLQQVMLAALNLQNDGLVHDNPGSGSPKALFKHAAQVLTRFGDWGCSLNLALLLHWRSEM